MNPGNHKVERLERRETRYQNGIVAEANLPTGEYYYRLTFGAVDWEGWAKSESREGLPAAGARKLRGRTCELMDDARVLRAAVESALDDDAADIYAPSTEK